MSMKKLFLPVSILFLCLCLYLSPPPSVNAQVAITEVFPDPQTPQDASEWLEIYNYSPIDIPISEITINDKPLVSEIQTLLSGQFLTITKNTSAFISEFGENNQIAQAAISLTNTSSNLTLKIKENAVHSLNYANVAANKSWQLAGFTCTNGDWLNHTNNSANINYNPECNILETQNSDLEIIYDLELEEINFLNSDRKIFGYSVNNYFYFGNNYVPETSAVLIGYYFENHKMFQSLPLVVNAEESENEEGTNTTTSESSSSSSGTASTTSASSSQSSNSSTTSSAVSVSSSSQSSASASSTSSNTSAQSQTSSSASTTNSSQTSSPQIINYTLEISEMYAAPTTAEKEWLEIYNYGSQNINLASCEIRDNSGKHTLAGEIVSKSYLQISDLKISLNNSGELIELYCASNLVNSWLQPATKQGETTARKLGAVRHEGEIIFTNIPTAGAENQFPASTSLVSSSQPSSSNQSKSGGSQTFSTNTKNSNNSQNSLNGSNAEVLGTDDSKALELVAKPTFAMMDYTFSDASNYQNEAMALMAGAAFCVFAQAGLILNVVFKNPDTRKALSNKARKLWQYFKKQFRPDQRR